MVIGLLQVGLDTVDVFRALELRHVSDALLVVYYLDEEGRLDFPREVDGYPDGVRHDDQVGEDANRAKQDVAVARNHLYRPQGFGKGLDGLVHGDDGGRPIAQNLVAIPGAARVALAFA